MKKISTMKIEEQQPIIERPKSFSRLYLHVHYPSDVIGGIVLGLICAKGALLITSGVNFFKVENNIMGYINLLMCSIISKS